MKKIESLVETTDTSKEVFSGKMLHAYSDEVILPDGNKGTREYVRHIGAVAVVALTDEGNIIMERQFRYPVDNTILEIPAGKLDSKEDHLEAAKRELAEETGIIADEWIELGKYFPAPAYSDEEITIYLAKKLRKKEQKLDPDEFLEVIEVPFSKAVEMVMNNEIIDGKTQIAILKIAYCKKVLL